MMLAALLFLLVDPAAFVRDVETIITPHERTVYKLLKTADERARFVDEFWARRDPTPGTAENEFQEEHYRRLEHAAKELRGDQARMYVTYGPPDVVLPGPGGEAWSYFDAGGVAMQIEFAGNRVVKRHYSILAIDAAGVMLIRLPIEFEASEYVISMDLSGHPWRELLKVCDPANFWRARNRIYPSHETPSPVKRPGTASCLSDTVYRANLGHVFGLGPHARFTAIVSDRAGTERRTYSYDFDLTKDGRE